MDITGKKFWKLTAIKKHWYKYICHINYICKCDCWNTTEATYQQLVTWWKISCWCSIKWINATHWMSGKRFYRIWFSIKERCRNKKNINYNRYWWRGITYCKEWELFENFRIDMEGWYSDTLTIDRIDSNWNYCKENCKWSTPTEQARNTRNNKIITIDWKTKVLSEWLEIYWRKSSTYRSRIQSGMSEIEAIITPIISK